MPKLPMPSPIHQGPLEQKLIMLCHQVVGDREYGQLALTNHQGLGGTTSKVMAYKEAETLYDKIITMISNELK